MTIQDFTNYPIEKRDLTNPIQNSRVLEIAEQLYQKHDNILGLEEDLMSSSKFVSNTSPVLLEAIKCAASKKKVSQLKEAVHLSVVFGMYNETARLQTKDENTHGEDCLREKVRQLNWLSKGLSAKLTWDIIAVDDGCPQEPSSYEVAQAIKEDEFYKKVEVLKLADAIGELVICQGFMDLDSPSDSRKGGAITYGLWKALDKFVSKNKKHIISYTDADLSSNLAQSGNLIIPIAQEGKKASLAHRYGMAKSVLVKENATTTEPESTRDQPGKLIILLRHYARTSLFPLLKDIKDTQAGFKAFDAEALREVLLYMEFMNETFDVELLLRFLHKHGTSCVENVPVLFTEDLAMSNFPANKLTTNHVDMFSHLADIYSKLGTKMNDVPDDVVNFWKTLDFEMLEELTCYYSQSALVEQLDAGLFDFEWSFQEIKMVAERKVKAS